MVAEMTAETTKRAHLSEEARQRIEQQGLRLDQELTYQGNRYFVTEPGMEAFESYGPEIAVGEGTVEEATFWVLKGEGYLGLGLPKGFEDYTFYWLNDLPCSKCNGRVLGSFGSAECLDCGNSSSETDPDPDDYADSYGPGVIGEA